MPRVDAAGHIQELAQALAEEQRKHQHTRERAARLDACIEEALLHYRIGREAASLFVVPTYVDWQYVCSQMAAALQPAPAAGEEEEHGR